VVILTNFENFPTQWTTATGIAGESRLLEEPHEYVRAAKQTKESIAVINCNSSLTLSLAARFAVTFQPPPLVAVDLILRRPRSIKSKLQLPVKRALLSRVDFFIHYFRDVSAYQAVFGISPERSAFVSFKVNLFDASRPHPSGGGDYVVCLGRTLRDFDTFFAAMEQVPYPGAISTPDFEQFQLHGARFSRTLAQLPKNVRILPDNGSAEGMLRILERAKIVVVPILKESMAASGCSTTLNAMWLGRCVIGTEGPGFSDVFQNGEVLSAPPEDPVALARVIRQAWEDDALRTSVAQAGFRFAADAGGEQELFQRVIEQVVTWYGKRRGERANESGTARVESGGIN
jgi:glycosyltransferase involved in cell wall biosynthesis